MQAANYCSSSFSQIIMHLVLFLLRLIRVHQTCTFPPHCVPTDIILHNLLMSLRTGGKSRTSQDDQYKILLEHIIFWDFASVRVGGPSEKGDPPVLDLDSYSIICIVFPGVQKCFRCIFLWGIKCWKRIKQFSVTEMISYRVFVPLRRNGSFLIDFWSMTSHKNLYNSL